MSVFRTILLIDEDSTSNMIFQKMASVAQISERLLVYPSVIDAIEFLKDNVYKPEELPDVIFLDLRMPEMSGWEFMEVFQGIKQEISKQIDIYIVSTSDNDEDHKRSQQYPEIKGYLVKPVSIAELKKMMLKH